ncbi:hypothetical protein MNBD_ACTINO02-2343 [hydrothermal vent metagenome]|uniref:Uncharacterized protein n=1 Tax=hydrothermal vent metagenome TaxID=652676 RepID=A0A3B0SXD4_9ZZZZ
MSQGKRGFHYSDSAHLKATERGAASGLVLTIVIWGIMMAWMVAAVAIAGTAKMRAESAADGAALAAAPVTFRPFGARGSATGEAARFARANGAELSMCTCRPDPSWNERTVEVRVVVYARVPGLGAIPVRAQSRATFDPLALLDEGAPEPAPP